MLHLSLFLTLSLSLSLALMLYFEPKGFRLSRVVAAGDCKHEQQSCRRDGHRDVAWD